MRQQLCYRGKKEIVVIITISIFPILTRCHWEMKWSFHFIFHLSLHVSDAWAASTNFIIKGENAGVKKGYFEKRWIVAYIDLTGERRKNDPTFSSLLNHLSNISFYFSLTKQRKSCVAKHAAPNYSQFWFNRKDKHCQTSGVSKILVTIEWIPLLCTVILFRIFLCRRIFSQKSYSIRRRFKFKWMLSNKGREKNTEN